MRLRSCLTVALVGCLSWVAALAQNQPASTVRTLLSTGRIGSVIDTPLAFRLLSVRLSPTQQASYTGPNAMLYAVAGGVRLQVGGDSQSVVEGGGAFIPSGRAAIFDTSAQEPANFLLFILSPVADIQKPPLESPGTVEELYRSPEPLPGLQPGPYEYSLTQVSLPPAMPPNPPHSRSGAALYYIAAGSGMFTAGGTTEPRTAGMAHFEPRGLVHQWANPGDAPLTLIQANISPEGIPTVLAAGAQ
jgi:quercetin dioxygenase-like cupin family protein